MKSPKLPECVRGWGLVNKCSGKITKYNTHTAGSVYLIYETREIARERKLDSETVKSITMFINN